MPHTAYRPDVASAVTLRMKTCVVPDALTLPSRRDSFSASVILKINKNLNMKSTSLFSNGELSVATCKLKLFVSLIDIFSLLSFSNHFHVTRSIVHIIISYDQGQIVAFGRYFEITVLWTIYQEYTSTSAFSLGYGHHMHLLPTNLKPALFCSSFAGNMYVE